MKIRLLEAESVPRGRKDRQAYRHEANSHFSQFCESN